MAPTTRLTRSLSCLASRLTVHYWQNQDGAIWFPMVCARRDKADLSEGEKHRIAAITHEIKRGLA